jgi:hypothetical protein
MLQIFHSSDDGHMTVRWPSGNITVVESCHYDGHLTVIWSSLDKKIDYLVVTWQSYDCHVTKNFVIWLSCDGQMTVKYITKPKLRLYDRHVTVMWQSHDAQHEVFCPVTVDNYCMTVRWRSDDGQVTVRWLFITVIWLLHNAHDGQMTVRWRSDDSKMNDFD